LSADGGECIQFVEQCFMVDAVEAFGNVGIKHVFSFLPNCVEYLLNRIMARASWSETV
jgi:hypothetical protein